jgi:hypothetical protein
VDDPSLPRTRLTENFKEAPPVAIVEEEFSLLMTACHDVIDGALELWTQWAGHGNLPPLYLSRALPRRGRELRVAEKLGDLLTT